MRECCRQGQTSLVPANFTYLELEREKGRAWGDGGEVCCAAPPFPPEGVVGVWGAGASPIIWL